MEVLALVGPSGTGKSFRAIRTAHEYEAEIIIDDGLIIKGDRILAGQSAKRQPTRIGAIKTALFWEPGHMREAREILSTLQPARVLILGTSREMAEKIACRLGLPPVSRFIAIEELASPREIRKARVMRTQYSKHVIPAPAMEVKKSFPGTIIDPLHVFLRRKGVPGNRSWLEQSVVRPNFTYYGKITIAQNALADIAARAARETAGVKDTGRINVQQREDGVIIELFLTVFYGYRMNELGRRVQALVKKRVEEMTGLALLAVHVVIKELSLDLRQPAQNKVGTG